LHLEGASFLSFIRYNNSMANESYAGQISFYKPARYRIRVQGRVMENWSDRLEGMTISLDKTNEKEVICTLEGELIDQGALLGVVNTLYELHLPVLSVQYLTSIGNQIP
jgi:hypothetical protein